MRLTLRSLAAFYRNHGISAAHAGRPRTATHSGELENLGRQVFEDGRHVDGGLGSDAHLVLGVVLQEALDTTARKL